MNIFFKIFKIHITINILANRKIITNILNSFYNNYIKITQNLHNLYILMEQT